MRLADALEELQKRPTLSSSSPNETSSSTPSGDKGQESLGGVAEGGASNSGKDDKVTTDEVRMYRVILNFLKGASLIIACFSLHVPVCVMAPCTMALISC